MVIAQSWQTIFCSKFRTLYDLCVLYKSWYNKVCWISLTSLIIRIIIKLKQRLIIKYNSHSLCFTLYTFVNAPSLLIPGPIGIIYIKLILIWKGTQKPLFRHIHETQIINDWVIFRTHFSIVAMEDHFVVSIVFCPYFKIVLYGAKLTSFLGDLLVYSFF